LLTHFPAAALAGAFLPRVAIADDKRVKVGVDVSLTGAGAEDAILVKNGALMAIPKHAPSGPTTGFCRYFPADQGNGR
jgi:hypothetical protein